MLAQDRDVEVQPQPFILGGVQPELPTDDLQVGFEVDATIKASTSTCDPELGKDRNLAIDGGDIEPLSEVDLDDDLPELTISTLVQRAIRTYQELSRW